MREFLHRRRWQRAPRRVLMVCTANVCRSPLAEALLRARLAALGRHGEIAVASAGTSVGAPGRAPDPRMVALARGLGVSMAGIRARPVTPQLLAEADFVLAMEQHHLDAIAAMTGDSSASPVARVERSETRESHTGASGGHTGAPNNPPALASLVPGYALLGSYARGAQNEIADPYFGSLDACREAFEQIDEAVEGLIPTLLDLGR